MNKAVVASPVDGNKELISDGKTGFLVEPGQVEKLADVLLLLIENEILRNELATNAEKYVRDNYSIENLVFHIESIYTQLLKQAKRV